VLAIVDLSGPTKAFGQQELIGIRAAAAYYNAHGGMDGHKVIVDGVDDGDGPTTAVNLLVQNLSSGSFTMVYPGSSSEVAALIPVLAKYKTYAVTLIDPANICQNASMCPNTFAMIDGGYVYHLSDATWFKQHGDSKIGIFQEDSPVEQGGTPTMEAVDQKLGLSTKVVTFPVTAVNVSSELAHLRSEGVDGIEAESLGAAAGYLLNARAALNWNVPIVFDVAGSGLDLTQLVPKQELSDVYETLCPCQVPSTDNTALATLEKYAPPKSISALPANLAGDGWDALVLLDDAITQAKSLDTAALTKATESLDSQVQRDPLYITAAAERFSATDHENQALTTGDFLVEPAGPVIDGQVHSLP
jgi:ABC-type branched-subunit amino acid transport system substrate-binding protein